MRSATHTGLRSISTLIEKKAVNTFTPLLKQSRIIFDHCPYLDGVNLINRMLRIWHGSEALGLFAGVEAKSISVEWLVTLSYMKLFHIRQIN
jgi:hypothetical protein